MTNDAVNSHDSHSSCRTRRGTSKQVRFYPPSIGESVKSWGESTFDDWRSQSDQFDTVSFSCASREDDVEDHPLPEVLEESDEKNDSEDESEHVPNRLKQREEVELFHHRLKGHSTYHPACTQCRAARGVHRHGRTQGVRGIEVQADFIVLGDYRIISLVEVSSGALGYVYMRSNHDLVITELQRWARSVGITGPSTATCYVKTDMESSLVRILEKGLAGRFECNPPQTPEATGAAERAVRYFKEMLSTLKQDYLDRKYQLLVNDASLPFITRYIANMHNFHHNVQGGNKTPMELVIGQARPRPTSSLLGASVFAETPSSVASPSESRYVVGSYLGPEYGSRGVLVSAKVGPPDDIRIKIFRAKSIRVLNRIDLSPELCDFMMKPLPDSDHHAKNPVHVPSHPAEAQNQTFWPDVCPRSGPPKIWLLSHGKTQGCAACAQNSFHGRKHSSACRARYRDWVIQQKPQGEEGQSSSSTSKPRVRLEPAESISVHDPRHPTAGQRFVGKQPPAVDPQSRQSEPQVEPDVPDVVMPDVDDDDDQDSIGSPSTIAPEDVADMDVDQLGKAFKHNPDQEDPYVLLANKFTHDLDHLKSTQGIETPTYPIMPLLSPIYLPKIGEKTHFEKYHLGGKDVHLAYPEKVFAETSGEQLDVQQTVAGRKVELDALNKVGFGKVVDKATADAYCKTHGINIIGTRWIVTEKVIDGKPDVRCRLVVQQVAQGSQAAQYLGFSSSTPSAESIRCLFTIASSNNWVLGTLDVSTAFMNARLPPKTKAVIRLPNDVSMNGNYHQQSFAILDRALNGLRCASRAWLGLAKEVLSQHGLKSCPSEPCLFSGVFRRNKFSCRMSLCIYVDDILVTCDDARAFEYLRDAFQERVQKIKICGILHPDKDGKITFLGREIIRTKKSKSLYVRAPTDYLKGHLEGVSATDVPPQLKLEKSTTELDETPLSAEAATKYRAILGKIAWFAQSRCDLLHFISILSVGQATPLHKHEIAMNKVLRFIKSTVHWFHEYAPDNGAGLQLYTDASWGNPSYSGYCLFFKGSLIKCVSRQQVSVALSACEAELVAAAQGSQEALGLLHVINFLSDPDFPIVKNLEEFLKIDIESISDRNVFTILTDSRSGQGFLSNDGYSRRTRHLNLAHAFIQRLLYLGIIQVEWLPTRAELADILTKITSKEIYHEIRKKLGYIELESPEDWQLVVSKSKKVGQQGAQLQRFSLSKLPADSVEKHFHLIQELLKVEPKSVLFIEMCTANQSGFSGCHLKRFHHRRVYVLQIAKEMDINKVSRPLACFLATLRDRYKCSVISWASPPCTAILKSCALVFNLSDIRMLEFTRSCIFWKSRSVMNFCNKYNLSSTSLYDRCAYSLTDSPSTEPVRHTYRVQSSIALQPRKFCRCQAHQALNKQDLNALECYPHSMTAEVCDRIMRELA